MLSEKHFHNLYRAHNAIANILDGRTADGTQELEQTVSFTTEQGARRAAAHQLRLLLCHCHQVLELQDVTPLTVKFLWYLTRTGKTAKDDILRTPVIPMIHAIKYAPHMIKGKAGLIAILRRHQQHLAREQAKKWCDLSADLPPRKLLWTNGLFTLEEATDPRHLLSDSIGLGHCVGTLYNNAALTHAKVDRSQPDALRFLHYWMKITSGQSRILTFIEADTPRVTIDFSVRTGHILAAQGKVSPMGEIIPIPAAVKEPLMEAIEVLPVKKRGAQVLSTLVFEPDVPAQRLQRISRFTPL